MLSLTALTHVVVDAMPADSVAFSAYRLTMFALAISVITLVAVAVQIWLAKRTLDATKAELMLSRGQLAESEKASRQTQEALELTQEQVNLSRQDAIASTRRAAPRIIAEMCEEYINAVPTRSLKIMNKGGGGASFVTLSGLAPGAGGASELVSAADHVIQALAAGEERRTGVTLPYPLGTYARDIRIRYQDALGNKYITEYRYINEHLDFPIFREPWLGEQFGFERPRYCSDRISWPVAHYERHQGFIGEEVDEEPEPEQEPPEDPNVFDMLAAERD